MFKNDNARSSTKVHLEIRDMSEVSDVNFYQCEDRLIGRCHKVCKIVRQKRISLPHLMKYTFFTFNVGKSLTY